MIKQIRRRIKKRVYSYIYSNFAIKSIKRDLIRIGYRQVGKIKCINRGYKYIVRCYYVGKKKAKLLKPLKYSSCEWFTISVIK